MQRRSLAAIFLTGLMVLSGCFGAISTDEDENSEVPLSKTVELSASWGIVPDSITLDGAPIQLAKSR